MTSVYRLLFSRAWRLTRKHKELWLLGFFAAFIGNGGVYEALVRSFNNLSVGRSIFDTLKEYSQVGAGKLLAWSSWSSLWHADFSSFTFMILSFLLVVCVVAFIISLAVICQGGLVRSAVDLDQKKPIGLRQSLRVGVERFWPILELNVITKVILLGILMLLAFIVSQLYFDGGLVSVTVYTIAVILFIILGIIIYFLTVYGTAYVVLRHQGSFKALGSAWRLFIRNIILNLEMGLLLFIINILVVVGFFILSFLCLAPFFLLYIIFLFSGVPIAATILIVIMALILAAWFVIFGAWWCAFQISVWSLLFEEIEMKRAKSKLWRVFDALRQGSSTSEARPKSKKTPL